MWRFIVGVAVGVVAGFIVRQTWLDRAKEINLGEIQERANCVLAESRRILEEARHELRATFEGVPGRREGESGGTRGKGTE